MSQGALRIFVGTLRLMAGLAAAYGAYVTIRHPGLTSLPDICTLEPYVRLVRQLHPRRRRDSPRVTIVMW